MKKSILLGATILLPATMWGQAAMDAYSLMQPDLKGTARSMSMAGAFGALGGDLSVLSQNPGGIGVYRSNEIGFTLDLDCQSAKATSQGVSSKLNDTQFMLNNIGAVATFRINSAAVPNINIGFTYNKAASFNRQYRGSVPVLSNSLSNYIAAVSNNAEVWESDLMQGDPYNPPANAYAAPWISVLGYDSFLIGANNYISGGDSEENIRTDWYGQWQNGTRGSGTFNVHERGGIDEYNIALGGNIANVVFWGMDFGIVDVNYTRQTYWGEALDGACVAGIDGVPYATTADWNLYNYFNMNGSGFNYKLGFIVKPIQELRLGFAFHTPTWYKLDQSFYGEVNYKYGAGPDFTYTDPHTGKTENLNPGYAQTNGGYDGYSSFRLRTPWKLIFSAAGVIGSRCIVSADYEWMPAHTAHFSDSYTDAWDAMYSENSYRLTNQDVRDYYQSQHTLRLGAEYRINSHWSARLGYSFVSSPVKPAAKDGQIEIYTSGTQPSYSWTNTTNYVTCGLGYRYKAFYADLAYVYRHQGGSFHAYTPDPTPGAAPSPSASLAFDSSQIALSMGLKF